jgi:pectate lyase
MMRAILSVGCALVSSLALGVVGCVAEVEPTQETDVVDDTTESALEVPAWPSASGEEPVTRTIEVRAGEVFDGHMKRFIPVGLGDGSQDEDQMPVFKLRKGATLKNVIIGAPGADGVHCFGDCSVLNVWWDDVGEDAATLKEEGTMTVDGGGARHASDKVFQHNAQGKFIIKNFYFEDFLKGYRSCGTCDRSFKRELVMENIVAKDGREALVRISNPTSKATLKNIRLSNVRKLFKAEGGAPTPRAENITEE